MTLCFITNYLTHHQLPFCEALYRQLGEGFTLLVTTPMEEERVRMGWELDARDYPFVVAYDADYERSHRLVRECDALICGGTHVSYIEERLALGKLTYRYFERLYKKGRLRAFTPRGYLGKLREHTRYRKSPVWLLCAGAYVPADFSLFGAYPGKMLRWGYFPETYRYTEEELTRPAADGSRERLKLLWTGRMLDWKHAEDAIRAVDRLRRTPLPLQLTMVGEGEQRAAAEALIRKLGCEREVVLLPFEKPEQIRERMRGSDVYLMTSDYQEGWGAVVNEAMNAGCALVASSGAGSVPYLIRHGENGLVYPSGDQRGLEAMLDWVCSEDAQKQNGLRKRLGQAAYRTITEEWNASVAAERLLAFTERVLAGESEAALRGLYAKGPMSPAPRIAPRDGYAYCRRDAEDTERERCG